MEVCLLQQMEYRKYKNQAHEYLIETSELYGGPDKLLIISLLVGWFQEISKIFQLIYQAIQRISSAITSM